MKYEFKSNDGKVVINDEYLMRQIHEYYEAACTGEYMQDNDCDGISDQIALSLGYEVWRRIYKYGGDESETIENVQDDFKDNILKWATEDPVISKQFEAVFEYEPEQYDSTISLSELIEWVYSNDLLIKSFELYFDKHNVA